MKTRYTFKNKKNGQPIKDYYKLKRKKDILGSLLYPIRNNIKSKDIYFDSWSEKVVIEVELKEPREGILVDKLTNTLKDHGAFKNCEIFIFPKKL